MRIYFDDGKKTEVESGYRNQVLNVVWEQLGGGLYFFSVLVMKLVMSPLFHFVSIQVVRKRRGGELKGRNKPSTAFVIMRALLSHSHTQIGEEEGSGSQDHKKKR